MRADLTILLLLLLGGWCGGCSSGASEPAGQRGLAGASFVETYEDGSLERAVMLSPDDGVAVARVLETLRASGHWGTSWATYVPSLVVRSDTYSFHLSGDLAIWNVPHQPQRTRRLSPNEQQQLNADLPGRP